MVGVGTLLADDPELTVRMVKGRNPLRIVVDSRLQTPLNSRLMDGVQDAPVIIATLSNDGWKTEQLTVRGAKVLRCREREGRVDLDDLLAQLGKRGIQSIDRYCLFLSPKFVGGAGKGLFAGVGAALMGNAVPLRIENVGRIGVDILVEAVPECVCSQG
jgi:diaminohydroxyphosphoribosylaminopyrimidine deaminase/5-amino-6-(5-phosphoribosylamino)uracil reductase